MTTNRKSLVVWILLSITMLSLLTACAAPQAAPTTTAVAPLPAEITVKQALDKRTAGAFILDVREPDEWTAGHIPNATLIPLGGLQNRLTELPKDRQIVVVCRSGNRSATGRDILLKAGFSQVTSMSGGMNQWSAAGYPIVTGP
jgi:rhodanese-related sulfurtransferase